MTTCVLLFMRFSLAALVNTLIAGDNKFLRINTHLNHNLVKTF